MLFSSYQQKVISKKTNKKRFKILEKGKYVTPDEIFEAFVGTDDDLTMMMNTSNLLNVQRCRKTNDAW